MILVFVLLLQTSLQQFLLSAEPPDEAEKLQQLMEKEWAFRMREYPLFATSTGDYRYNDRLPEMTVAAEQRRGAFWQDMLQQLQQIDREALPAAERVNYDFFQFVLQDQLAGVHFESYLVPLNSEGGFHTDFMFMADQMPFRHEQDYLNYLSRLKGFPAYVEQHVALMRKGLQQGMTPPQVILQGFEATIDPYIVEDPAVSYFYTPFLNMPTSMTEPVRQRLKKEALQVIAEKVVPGYRSLRTFLVEEYRPGAVTSIAVTDWPRGKEYYAQRVRYFTTLDMSPEEVFALGQQEVGRIRQDMQRIVDSLAFKGSFKDFLQMLRTDARFYAQTPEELLKEAAFIAKEIDGKLPALFSTLPRLPYGVAPVPDAIAPRYTGGRYVPGSPEQHRAGTYWVNTYNLKSRPLYVLPALTLHEAVPGHHLQISLSQEMEEMAPFRRHTYLSAYGEGWGLYAEWLGKEMGIYKNPYQEFGRLTYEMWRACRLVVDVGMHAKGWSRQQAVDFMASHTALSLHEVNTEIDRYIGWPAQALSYKIGELKIRELRSLAAEKLGARFDIREFHEVVLRNGSVPLFVLESLVHQYIAEKKP